MHKVTAPGHPGWEGVSENGRARRPAKTHVAVVMRKQRRAHLDPVPGRGPSREGVELRLTT